MAICIAEVVKDLDPTRLPMITVLGTDISTNALAKAKSGIYTKEEVKGLSDNFLMEYFRKTPQGYEACPALRKGMRFSRENLLEDPQSKYFDAIVCRNVMIYFSREMHDKVATNLYHALMRGGYLMLGKTETLMGAPREAFEVVDLENRILKKKA
jgi:chemotaxis protein methyltransferase CheR